MEQKKALVILSGGQDSTTCLAWAKLHCQEVIAITFNYGQRHKREIESAINIAHIYEVEHEVVDLGHGILEGTSPLVSDNQLEQYQDFNSLPGGLEKTFVPCRNALFIVVALNRAYVHECDAIVTGVCQEDYGGYPDCRQDFITALQHAMTEGLDKVIRIETPLMYLTKAETCRLALDLPRCYEALADSHTSYDGNYPPTGKDHATLLREKGFFEAGIPDPLVLSAVNDDLMPMPETSNYRGNLELYQRLMAGECTTMQEMKRKKRGDSKTAE